ncbi:hypothetical protein [Mycolicibacterium conceptionense]|uniref:Uncharacterized protein n=1 Tax=Mycolicibacterium conceptionense TaxID=451644 RepID=A0A1A1YEW3_9MYCO|nr:hypothetical protein [Mycolicibacterium conceptionense]OBF29848.1 hypothetical protein A5726_30105 [Mycolicibacterium conceptionense]OBF43718.1 hypothetical protein A5720_11875 [Mycolicibacterium conceptionense]
MLRTVTALTAVLAALGIAFTPIAAADPDTKNTGTESSQPSKPAHQAAPPTRIKKGAHLAGRPAGDWRQARKDTMDRYFDGIREKREQQIRDWFDSLHR